MDKRTQILNSRYGDGREETRLARTRHGQLEYLTTMDCIDRYAPYPGAVLELGAGTGTYSLALAREGYRVTALELADGNVKILREKAKSQPRLTAVQGDALDLSSFADDSFDLTLCLGPLYHLFDPQDMDRALNEAIRVTKPGGTILAAFLSVHAILCCNYLQRPPYHVGAGLEENFEGDLKTVRHFPEQGFTGFTVEGFEALFADKPVSHIATVSTDGPLELAEDRADFYMTDEDFRLFSAYHLAHCEKRELLGSSAHLLYICRKL